MVSDAVIGETKEDTHRLRMSESAHGDTETENGVRRRIWNGDKSWIKVENKTKTVS